MINAQSNFYKYDADGNPLGLSWAGCEAARVAKLRICPIGSGYSVAVDEAGEEVDLETLPKRSPAKAQVEMLGKLLADTTVDINSNSLNSLLAKDLVRPVKRQGGRFVDIEFEPTAHGCVSYSKAKGWC